MPARRQRLDAELVRRGLARSRTHAAELIAAGRVSVSGSTASKPATQVDTAAALLLTEAAQGPDFVSRGAHKLLGALAAFPQVQVAGRRCLDAGASTGGFTDVLLRHGAAHVVAVDVGYGQLAWGLQTDPRVTVLDRTNVRNLTPDQVAPAPALVVGDLSFISLRLVLAPLVAAAAPGADLLLMVKPQFEVGRARLGSGGVVRNGEHRVEAVLGVADTARELGLAVLGCAASPLPGPSGNVEYFLWLRRPDGTGQQARGGALTGDDLSRAVRLAVESGPGGPPGDTPVKPEQPEKPSRPDQSAAEGQRGERAT